MILVNTSEIAGREIVESLGLVQGNVIRAKHIGNDIIAGLRQIVGGEVKEYTKMLDEARQQATKRMVDQASSMGADAVVNIRYASAQVMTGAAEIVAYGTAVKLK